MLLYKTRRVAVIAATVAAATALTLTGCTSASSANGDATSSAASSVPHRGGNLTVQISQDPGSLDPVASTNKSTFTISNYLFEKLFALDANNNAQPMLVKDFAESNGGLTYTMHLRSGIRFSDGTPLTSADVLASTERWLKLSTDGQAAAPYVKSVTAPDDQTIVFQMSSVWPLPLALASSNASIIIEKHTAETSGATGFKAGEAIGTGVYELEKWVPGQEIVLKRNPYYTSPPGKPSGYAGARHAYLDTITFKVVSDSDAAINGLQAGQWGVVTTPDPSQYKRLESDPNLRVSTTFGGNVSGVFFNDHPGRSLMASQKARDGINLILNKKAIAATTGQKGLTDLTSAWADKQNASLYSTAGKSIWSQYDPKKGAELLKEAGYKPGQTLHIITTGEFPQFVTWATAIQDELKQAGIKADVETYDFSTMIAKAKDYDFDLMVLFDDTDFVLPQLSVIVQGILPYLGVDPIPADLQKLINDFTAASATGDKAGIRKAANAIQQRVWTVKPTITFAQDKSYIAYTKKLHGYDHFQLDFWNTWLSK